MSIRQAILISGSRNPHGQTARAAEAFLDGLKTAGVGCESFFLPSMMIERCRQCDEKGWGQCHAEDRCSIRDDFAGLVAKIKACDLVVFANPVYFGDLSESMRAFLDRLRRTCRQEKGRAGIATKHAVGICVAGGGGGGAPACMVSMERFLATCGFDVLDLIPVRRQNLDLKVELLRATGRWIATHPPVV